MKKGIIFIVLGIALIAASTVMHFTVNNTVEDNSGMSIEEALDGRRFYKLGGSFNYIYFEKYKDQYLMTARNRKYTNFDTFPTAKDSDFREALTLKDNVLTSELGVKVTFKNGFFVLEAPDDFSMFNGTYEVEDENNYYTIIKDTDDIAGLYMSPGGVTTDPTATTYNFNITKLNDDTYAIVGFIRKPSDNYIFSGERIEMKDGIGEVKLRDVIHYFSLKEDKLSIEGTDDCILEGDYPKSNKVKFIDLVTEMEKVHIYAEDVTGSAINK